VTRDVAVRVRPTFLPQESDPAQSRYVWAYLVEIENRGDQTVQLHSRRWIITDALNRTEEVSGEGVVGHQPTLRPQEAWRYTSFCPLATHSGAMRGAYQMISDTGEAFDVAIPEFSLHLPDAAGRMN